MKTAAEYLQRQTRNFRGEWERWGYFWAGVASLEGFRSRLLGNDGWTALDGVRQVNAVVVGPHGESPEIWVRPAYSDYEGAFAAFAHQYYDFDYAAAAEKQLYDVDHVFSHTRAGPDQLDLAYVRLALVNRSINRSWGSFVEKVMVTTDASHRGKTHHFATCFLLAKLIGCRAPSKSAYRRDIGSIADFIVNSGFEPGSARDRLVFEMRYLYEVEVLQVPPTSSHCRA